MRPATTARERGTGAASLQGLGREGLRRSLGHLRAIPFTLAVLAAFLITGAATGSFLAGPPESLLDVASVSAPGLKAGNWWPLFGSMFFATNLLAYAAAALMILLLLGLAERQLGTRRTAVFYFAAQFAAVTLFLLVTQLARYADDGWLGRMVDAPVTRKAARTARVKGMARRWPSDCRSPSRPRPWREAAPAPRSRAVAAGLTAGCPSGTPGSPARRAAPWTPSPTSAPHRGPGALPR